MRKQQRLIPALVALLATVLLASCTDEYVSPLEGRSFSDMTFTSENSMQTISFEGEDLSHLLASTDDSWCQAYFRTGEFRVVVMPNTTYSERTSTVHVWDAESGTQVSFKLTQLQNNAILPVDEEVVAPVDGGEVKFKYQTNVAVDYVRVTADWLTVTRGLTRALEDKEGVLTVQRNDGGVAREAYVEMGNNDAGIVCRILIHQQAAPYIILDRQIVHVDENGGEVLLGVQSNLDYRFDQPSGVSWLQVGERTEVASNSYQQRITVSPLPDGLDSRRLVLYLTSQDMSFYKDLTILQERSQQ